MSIELDQNISAPAGKQEVESCHCSNQVRLNPDTLKWLSKALHNKSLPLQEINSEVLKSMTTGNLTGAKVVLPHTIVFDEPRDRKTVPLTETHVLWYYSDLRGTNQQLPTTLITPDAIYFAMTHQKFEEVPENDVTYAARSSVFDTDLEVLISYATPPALSDQIVEPQAMSILRSLSLKQGQEQYTGYNGNENEYESVRNGKAHEKQIVERQYQVFLDQVVVAEFTPSDLTKPKIALTPSALRSFLKKNFVAANRIDTVKSGPRYLPTVSGVLQQFILPQTEIVPRNKDQNTSCQNPNFSSALIRVLSTARYLKPRNSERDCVWEGIYNSLASPFFLESHQKSRVLDNDSTQRSIENETISQKQESLVQFTACGVRLRSEGAVMEGGKPKKSQTQSRLSGNDEYITYSKFSKQLQGALKDFGSSLASISPVLSSSTAVNLKEELGQDHDQSERKGLNSTAQGQLLDFDISLSPTISPKSMLFWIRGFSRWTYWYHSEDEASGERLDIRSAPCLCVLCSQSSTLSTHAIKVRKQREVVDQCPLMDESKFRSRVSSGMYSEKSDNQKAFAKQTNPISLPVKSTDTLEEATLLLCKNIRSNFENQMEQKRLSETKNNLNETNAFTNRQHTIPASSAPNNVLPASSTKSFQSDVKAENQVKDNNISMDQRSINSQDLYTNRRTPPNIQEQRFSNKAPLQGTSQRCSNSSTVSSPLEELLKGIPVIKEAEATTQKFRRTTTSQSKRDQSSASMERTQSQNSQPKDPSVNTLRSRSESSEIDRTQVRTKRSIPKVAPMQIVNRPVPLRDAITVDALSKGLPVPNLISAKPESRSTKKNQKVPWLLPAPDAAESLSRSQKLRNAVGLADRVERKVSQQREQRQQHQARIRAIREHVFENYRISRIQQPGTVESMNRERMMRMLSSSGSVGSPLNIPESVKAYLLEEDLNALTYRHTRSKFSGDTQRQRGEEDNRSQSATLPSLSSNASPYEEGSDGWTTQDEHFEESFSDPLPTLNEAAHQHPASFFDDDQTHSPIESHSVGQSPELVHAKDPHSDYEDYKDSTKNTKTGTDESENLNTEDMQNQERAFALPSWSQLQEQSQSSDLYGESPKLLPEEVSLRWDEAEDDFALPQLPLPSYEVAESYQSHTV